MEKSRWAERFQGWVLTGLLSVLTTAAIGAFADERAHQATADARIDAINGRVLQLEGTDRLSVQDRDQLRAEMKQIQQRQDRVIAVLATIKPDLVRSILEVR